MARQQVLAGMILALFGGVSVCAQYSRTAYAAELPLGAHNVEGTVTILDERTLFVEDFYYDGGGPAVYFYLGEEDSTPAFEDGLQLMPLLTGTVYNGEDVFLTLPPGETLQGYNAISVWCVDFSVSFSSGSFEAPATPYARQGWVADFYPGSHDVDGTVTIIDAETLYVERFHYDGGGPAVYFYLGAEDSTPSFADGLRLLPLLTGTMYSDDDLCVTLPEGESLDGYNAISVWCDAVGVSFSSASFEPYAVGDVNCDGAVDFDDISPFVDALGGEISFLSQYPDCQWLNADADGNGTVDFDDINPFVGLLGG